MSLRSRRALSGNDPRLPLKVMSALQSPMQWTRILTVLVRFTVCQCSETHSLWPCCSVANDEVVASAAAPRNKRHQRTSSTLDVPAPVAAVSTEPALEVVSQANAPIAVDEVKSSKPASSGRKQLAKRSGQAAVAIAPEPTSAPAAVAAPAVIEVAAASGTVASYRSWK